MHNLSVVQLQEKKRKRGRHSRGSIPFPSHIRSMGNGKKKKGGEGIKKRKYRCGEKGKRRGCNFPLRDEKWGKNPRYGGKKKS